MNIPRIMIAAPKSGSGKTTITCALLRCLKNRDINVKSFKCGPDYIDPMFHRKVLGIESENLDLFFTDEETTAGIFQTDNNSDISVVEGVMGLYDGLGGVSMEGSSYHMAKALGIPIILVVDAHGMGRSALAEVAGFLSMDAEHLIKGVIFNRMPQTVFDGLRPLIEGTFDIEALGAVPDMKDIAVESRYLGLTLPDEIENIQSNLDRAAGVLEETINLKRLLQIACDTTELPYPGALGAGADNGLAHRRFQETQSEPVRVAVAMDEAFGFYYEDNFRMLKEAGATLIPFSPIHDSTLPLDIDGIILGGGYPELYAEKLSANTKMRNLIKRAIKSGIPSLAECGGFMYLHESITDRDGNVWPMCKVIKGDCRFEGHLVRFGYVRIEDLKGGFLRDEVHNMIRGHEFHYYDSSNNGNDCMARKPVGGREWECGHVEDNHWWSYAHLFYRSNPDFVKRFVEECKKYQNA